MTDPVHTSPDVQHVDVRLYFPRGLEGAALLDKINQALGESPHLVELVSAFELVGDGFGRTVPADEPLA